MPAILVHALDDALAAADAAAEMGVPLRLISAPAAGLYAGAAWFQALLDAVRDAHPALSVGGVLDCDNAPGAVLAALRAGVTDVVFLGDGDVAKKLSAIAGQTGARLLTERPPALDPRRARDKRRACRDWLSSGQTDVRP